MTVAAKYFVEQAQAEHTLVVQAFGAKSPQAAQSAARLTAAQNNAKRASDAAAYPDLLTQTIAEMTQELDVAEPKR